MKGNYYNYDKITEDWYVSRQKIEIFKLYLRCGEAVGKALVNPKVDNVKRAIAYLIHYTSVLPNKIECYPEMDNVINKKWKIGEGINQATDTLLKMLYDLQQIVYSVNPSQRVLELCSKYNISYKIKHNELVILNMLHVVRMLNEIYRRLGAISYSIGLWFKFPEERIVGMEKIKEDEAIDNLDLDLVD